MRRLVGKAIQYQQIIAGSVWALSCWAGDGEGVGHQQLAANRDCNQILTRNEREHD